MSKHKKTPKSEKPSTLGFRESVNTEHKSDYCTHFNWTIHDFANVKIREIASPFFDVSKFRFRLRLYPQGKTSLSKEFMGLGLDLDTTSRVPQIGVLGCFDLCFENQLDVSNSASAARSYRFTLKDHTGGYYKFAKIKEVLDPTLGFLVDQSLHVKAKVTVLDDSLSQEQSKSNSEFLFTGKCNWSIKNFSLFKDFLKSKNHTIMSPAFSIGRAEYRICVWETLVEGVGYLSLYLLPSLIVPLTWDGVKLESLGLTDADIKKGVTDKSYWGTYGISVLNQNPDLRHIHKKSQGRFETFTEFDTRSDLGWDRYMLMSDFMVPEKGFLVDDDKVIFSVNYNVVEELYYTQRRGNTLAPEIFISPLNKCDNEVDRFLWEILNFTHLKDAMKKLKMTGAGIPSKKVPTKNGIAEFRVVVYPRGFQSHNPSYLSLFLELSASSSQWLDYDDTGILLHYRLGIVHLLDPSKSIIKQSLVRCFEFTEGIGWKDFVPLDTYFDYNKGFVRDGAAVFFAEVNILQESFMAEDDNYTAIWKVESFLTCKEIVTSQKVFSELFEVSGNFFRIGLFVSVDTLCLCLDYDPSCSKDPDGNYWLSFSIALLNEKDPDKNLWKEASLFAKTCNNYYLQMIKLSDVLEQDAGYIVENMLSFAFEMNDFSPWFEFSESQGLASDDSAVSLSGFGEPLNSLEIEQSVKDGEVSSSFHSDEPLNSKDTEPELIVKNEFGEPSNSLKTEQNVKDDEVSSSFKSDEPLKSKDTEPELIVKKEYGEPLNTLETKQSIKDGEVYSSFNTDEPLKSEDTEPEVIVKNEFGEPFNPLETEQSIKAGEASSSFNSEEPLKSKDAEPEVIVKKEFGEPLNTLETEQSIKDGEVSSSFNTDEPLKSEDTEVIVKNEFGEPLDSLETEQNIKDDEVSSSFNSEEPSKSKDTEPELIVKNEFVEPLNSLETEQSVKDGETSSSFNSDEPLNSKDPEPEPIVKDEVAMSNDPQPLAIVVPKQGPQLDLYTLTATLLVLRFHLDDLDEIKLFQHLSNSGVGDLNDVSDESLPTSEHLKMAINYLKGRIDAKLIDIIVECLSQYTKRDIMVECFPQSTKRKPSQDSSDAISIASLTTSDFVPQWALLGDIQRELEFEEDLWISIDCIPHNIGATIQTILEQLISQLGNFPQLSLGNRSTVKAETESPEEELVSFVNFLKPLSASISVICLKPYQWVIPLDKKVTFILRHAPIAMKPYLVALLCKLVDPLENPGAADKLLTPLNNLVSQTHDFAAINQSHFIGNKLWEHVFSQNLVYLRASRTETLDLIVCLLFRTGSLCQRIPQAVRAVRESLERLRLTVPDHLLKRLGKTKSLNTGNSSTLMQQRIRSLEDLIRKDLSKRDWRSDHTSVRRV